jgi:hypothetical protein
MPPSGYKQKKKKNLVQSTPRRILEGLEFFHEYLDIRLGAVYATTC